MCYVIRGMLCYTFNMDNYTDEQLIKEYLAGDEKALESLVAHYLNGIYNFSFRLSRDASQAEDITQEVFIKVWKNLKKFDREKSFKAWIFRIARNTAIDYLRRKKIFVFSDLENDESENSIINNIPDPMPLPDKIFDRQNLKEELDIAIKKLPSIYQTIVILHGLEELSFQEISEVLSEPLNTVKSRYLRALSKLRSIMIND
jgi:RNA polymerase sigma-70 factor, ECF subfamily